jgi:hypothetical protein
MRYTGCIGAILRKDLCPLDKLTGRPITVQQVYGQPMKMPLAEVKVDTPYYSSMLRIAVIHTQVSDLIIGNILGARCIHEPDQKWDQTKFMTANDDTLPKEKLVSDKAVDCAVITRAQSKTTTAKPLKVPKADLLKIDKTELIKFQSSDPTLQIVRRKVDAEIENGKSG